MAVVANNVYFTHERVTTGKYALNGVNMNVQVGCIYGLLGPSGCGKTTLLKCIIGLLQPNFGDISLFGYKPGDGRSGVPGGGIGYMPQELAIQYDLTIEEILTYFGKLNCMESKYLSNEIDNLVKILELWDKQKLVGQLSCGQKRRVSLAIAMLHKPRLLILDEPTVGVDPILIEVIWNLLKTLSSTLKTTIIITTHYISETRRANCVAFMRQGLILEENNPKTLLGKYEALSLDDVFLKLCVEKEQNTTDYKLLEYKCKSDSQTNSVNMPYRSAATSEFEQFFTFLYAIIWKFMIETRRNPLAVTLVLGTTISIIFGVKLVFGQPRNLAVAWVVDEHFNYSNYSQHSVTTVNYNETKEGENSDSTSFLNNSTSFVNSGNYSEIQEDSNIESTSFLNNSSFFVTSGNYSEIEETTSTETKTKEYEELYLPNILRKSIDGNVVRLVEYSDFLIAMKDAKKTKVRAIIYLKSNFSSSYLSCDPMFAEVDEFITDGTIDGGSIHVYIDFADFVVGQIIRAVIAASVQPFRKSIGEQFNVNQNLLSSPVILKAINFDDDNHTTSVEDVFSVVTFITPGIVVLNSFVVCTSFGILALVIPVECDMFVRDYTAGVKPMHTVLGQVIARFIFMFFNAILNLLTIVYFLDVPCRGSVVLILILMWMQMLLGLNIGVLVSAVLTKSDYKLFIAVAISLIFLSSNGVVWSIEVQPYYLKWLTRYSPLYYSTNTLRAMLLYSNPSFHVVWPGFAMTALWTIVAFFGAVHILSAKK